MLVDGSDGGIHDLPSTSAGPWFRTGSDLLVGDSVDRTHEPDANVRRYLTVRFLVWVGGTLREVAASRVKIEGKEALEWESVSWPDPCPAQVQH